jgi:hypothetical protein
VATVAEVTTAPSGEVTIAGRMFRLGVVYAPVPHVRPYEPGRLLPLRLVGHDPAHPWPDGRVVAEYVSSADSQRRQTRRLSGRAWAAWVGEAVGDSLEDIGR